MSSTAVVEPEPPSVAAADADDDAPPAADDAAAPCAALERVTVKKAAAAAARGRRAAGPGHFCMFRLQRGVNVKGEVARASPFFTGEGLLTPGLIWPPTGCRSMARPSVRGD